MDSEIYQRLTNETKPFVLAEIGSNHMASMETAKELIDAAVEAGCDGVKFQSLGWNDWNSKTVFQKRRNYTAPGLLVVGLEATNKLLELSKEQHHELKRYCDEKGILFSSTPATNAQIDMLVDELKVPFLKIASMDLTNHDFLRYAASKGVPIVLSTGMALLHEIAEAVEVIKGTGNDQLILLHCVATYPTPHDWVDLQNISMLKDTFGFPIGFSDHTLTADIPIASVALGACFIEKHFMLEGQECREKKVSITPSQMKRLVEGAHNVGMAMGTYHRRLTEQEVIRRGWMRRGILVRKDLPAGHILTREDLVFKRPSGKIPAKDWKYVVGRKLKEAREADDVLGLEDFE